MKVTNINSQGQGRFSTEFYKTKEWAHTVRQKTHTDFTGQCFAVTHKTIRQLAHPNE